MMLQKIGRSRWPPGLMPRTSPLRYWDHGFESRSKLGCLSSCFCVVLFCIGRSLCDVLIAHPEESYRVSKYDHAQG
jgi:hypothetical protein